MKKIKRIITAGIFLGLFCLNYTLLTAQSIVDNDTDVLPEKTELKPVNIANMKDTDSPYVLIVDKSEQLLYLYGIEEDLKWLETFHCSTGRNNGNKQKSGDLRTPEGIYYFSGIKEEDELLPQYGIRAFVINYPNRFDEVLDKDGFGIWLHATDEPDRVKLPNDSKGCIIVTNDDILRLSDYIMLDKTPIIVEEKISYVSSADGIAEKDRIVSFIERWIKSWEEQNINDYINNYSDSFYSQKMNLRRWKRYKKKLFEKYSNIDVKIEDISILEKGNMFVVNFKQKFSSDMYSDTGSKRLYILKNEKEFKIVGEEWKEEDKPFFVNRNQQKVMLDGR